jgi:hypothetical protein
MSLLTSVNESSPGNQYVAPTQTPPTDIGVLSNNLRDLGFVASTYIASQTESFGTGVPSQSVRISNPGYYAITTSIAGANWSSTGTASYIKFQLYKGSALPPITIYPMNLLAIAGTLTQTIIVPLDAGLYTGLIILTVGGGETVTCADRTSIVSMTIIQVA